MARKQKKPEIPADILAMSFEDLEKQHNRFNDPDRVAEFNALIEARDKAQKAVSDFLERERMIQLRYLEVLIERRKQSGIED